MDNTYEDHVGRRVNITEKPKRIISLCPSITETLYDLDLNNCIAGRTQFCIHPEHLVKNAAVVGGTKKIKMEVVNALKPDLIIAEKEENPKEMIIELEKHFPVYVTDVESYEDALKMIVDLGLITGQVEQANKLLNEINRSFKNIAKQPIGLNKVAYVIWQKPYMVAGNHTFINSILETAGFVNVFKHFPGRYPQVTIQDFNEADPDFVFLSSEPFPFKEKHQKEFERIFPGKQVILVDGEIFSWYGSHMLKAPGYINRFIESIVQN